jgi:ABC-type multidrug transport system ATPase subunit
LRGRPDLLVIDDWPLPEGALEQLAAESGGGLTVFLATSSPANLDAFARRVGILVRGRLFLDEETETLLARFRRIRYVNQITETRIEYGNELEEFEAVRVKARGWGVEAIVSNFTEEAFERFRRLDGVEEARAEPLLLAEIYENMQ